MRKMEKCRLTLGEMAWQLFLVFLALKLGGKIAWGWWSVFAPLLGAFGLDFLMTLAGAVMAKTMKEGEE